MKVRKKTTIHEIEDAVLTASEREASRMAFHFNRKWLVLFLVISLVVVCGLMYRVFYLSVVRGNYYRFVASGNSVREVPLRATRGHIFSADNHVLAENIPSSSIMLLPEHLPESDEERSRIVRTVAEILSTDVLSVQTQCDTARETMEHTYLAENIPHEQVLAFRAHEHDLPGVALQQTAQRRYPDGEIFAHIIGYEGLIKKDEYDAHKDAGYLLTDHIGKTGIEYQYEKYLHGTHGSKNALVDSRGDVVKDLIDTAPVRGYDVHLNIDAELQSFLTKRLAKECERAETRRAMAVVIDPRDGAVRALVSLPSYDNNAFAGGIDAATYSQLINDPDRPLFHRAIAGLYAPGSTVKPIMGIATLGENIVPADYQIESRGGITVGSFTFGDWRAHGFTDLRRAIAVSSDVYFYTVGGGYGNIAGLGIARMKEYMTRFGYGRLTGIDLPGESAGRYPDAQWKEEHIGEKWYVGNTYHASIGQGYVEATALQVAHAIVPIANGGTQYVPHVVGRLVHPKTGEEIPIAPQIGKSDIAPQKDIRIVQEGMRQTVTDGTATMLKSLPVAVAGKTGTAQFGTSDNVHSWFVSYAPYDNPEMVMVIMVEDQTGTISSSTVPVAHDVYQWYYTGKDTDAFFTDTDSSHIAEE